MPTNPQLSVEPTTMSIICPNCNSLQFQIESPAPPPDEPKWFVTCDECLDRYWLVPDGTMQLVNYGERY